MGVRRGLRGVRLKVNGCRVAGPPQLNVLASKKVNVKIARPYEVTIRASMLGDDIKLAGGAQEVCAVLPQPNDGRVYLGAGVGKLDAELVVVQPTGGDVNAIPRLMEHAICVIGRGDGYQRCRVCGRQRDAGVVLKRAVWVVDVLPTPLTEQPAQGI